METGHFPPSTATDPSSCGVSEVFCVILSEGVAFVDFFSSISGIGITGGGFWSKMESSTDTWEGDDTAGLEGAIGVGFEADVEARATGLDGTLAVAFLADAPFALAFFFEADAATSLFRFLACEGLAASAACCFFFC